MHPTTKPSRTIPIAQRVRLPARAVRDAAPPSPGFFRVWLHAAQDAGPTPVGLILARGPSAAAVSAAGTQHPPTPCIVVIQAATGRLTAWRVRA